MNELLEHLREELRRDRQTGVREGCLSETALQAIADGSLGVLETSAARQHMAGCLECLHAYAELRALWEMATSSDTRSGWRTFMRRLYHVLAARVPAWVVPAVATVPLAAALMLWLRLPSGTSTEVPQLRTSSTAAAITTLSGADCAGGLEGSSRANTAASGRAPAGTLVGTVARVAQTSQGAVVQVLPFGKEGKPRDCASGFFISADGAVVTASHAVQGARNIFIKISNGATFPVEGVLAVHSEADVAVLKVSGRHLPTLKLGDSDKIFVGESVIAIGNPMGFENSVSSGVVSAIRPQGEHVLIQITTPIAPGSSGGPLLNEKGEVIGVVTSSVTQAQNLNFAVAINEVKKLSAGPGARSDVEMALQAYLAGVLYMNKKDYPNAEKNLLTATRLDPKNVDAWLDLGSVYYYLRQRQKEGEAYNKALSVEPKNSQAHYFLGAWYEDNGRFERAIAEYRIAVTIDPTDDVAWSDLGELELILGHRSAAVEAVERLKTLNQGLAIRLNRLIELSKTAATSQ
jgi:S1-C subfamily serine protease